MKMQKTRAGFTLVEVLISLTILATLMTAVAFAFDAAVTNYQANKGIYETVNTGRQALLRITNDLRISSEVALIDHFESNAQLLQDADTSLIGLMTKDGCVWYTHEDTNSDGEKNELCYVVDKNGNWQIDVDDGWYTLCDNITEVTFDRTEDQIDRCLGTDTYPTTIWAVRDVRIVLTVTDETGDISKTLAAATLIRKNQ